MWNRKFSLLLSTLVLSLNLEAQVVDLLPKGGNDLEENFDSTRYKKSGRPGSNFVPLDESPSRAPKRFEPKFQPIPDSNATEASNPPISQPYPQPEVKANAGSAGAVISKPASANPLPKKNTPNSLKPDTQVPAGSAETSERKKSKKSMGQNVEDLILGGSPEEIKEYQKKLKREDARHNFFDLDVAPVFIHSESKSSYSYRQAITSNPGVHLGARIWVGPFFGFDFSHTTTLSGSLKNGADGDRSLMSDQWTRAGIRLRRFFSSGEESHLNFVFGFQDYQRRFQNDDEFRMRLSSRGPYLGVETQWDKQESSHWLLGTAIRPAIGHKEASTGINAKAGDGNQSFGIDSFVGKEIRLNRTNAVYWKLKHSYEKNQFSGRSELEDYDSGEKLENVGVENTTLFLEIGYTWSE